MTDKIINMELRSLFINRLQEMSNFLMFNNVNVTKNDYEELLNFSIKFLKNAIKAKQSEKKEEI